MASISIPISPRRRRQEALERPLLLRLALRQTPRIIRTRRSPLLSSLIPRSLRIPSVPLYLPPHHTSRMDRDRCSENFMCVLDDGTFSAEGKLQGNGVNYHVATVFLKELRHFLPLKPQVIEVLLKPFISAMGKFPDKVLLTKIKSGVFDVLLKMGKRLLEVKKSGEEVDSGDDVVVFGTVALVMGFSVKFYELGSSAECCQGNRKVLFGLHSEFLKLEKDAAGSGFEFSVPDVLDRDDDEVPELVPILNGGSELLMLLVMVMCWRRNPLRWPWGSYFWA
ncbi:hypothetical protein RJT34_06803 [Clitoria ternatea]|uniref:Uncharacterized protein n=1 Tax=Clitoria ternatea TaxID=43366 RepID=A0AAN9K228_CLITE